jgi:glycosyltransferase involved in cell wall biosynthesis
MVTTFYPPYHFGGDGIYIHRLCNELAQRGHHVEVIHNADAYLVLAGREPNQTCDNHPNVTVHTLRSGSPLLSALAMQQSGTPALHSHRIRTILDQGFDVIHYHNVSLAGGPQVLQYGHALKLYTLHEYWLVCPTHVLFRFNREACTRRSCFLCQLLYKRPPQLWRYTPLLQQAAAQVRAFLAPSDFAAQKHRQYGFAGPLVHLPHFAPRYSLPRPLRGRIEVGQSEGGTPSKPYFLFVGRLERLKGLHTLIPPFRRYGRAQLWIAGGGKEESSLREMAAGCDNIRFLGWVDALQQGAVYRDAVAVIVPSLCYEVFSLVQLEAFQQGTPVIVRNLGALPEAVQESDGGLVYNTEEELLLAMDRLLADRAWRDELGEHGHRTYLERWTPEAHLENYLGLIEKLGSQPSPQAGDEQGRGEPG